MRSQWVRASAYRPLALAMSPALTAATNAVVPSMRAAASSSTHSLYSAAALVSAAVEELVALLAVPVTVKSARMPSPVSPGLQAVLYVPGSSTTVRSRVSAGPMFSTSATMRTPSSA